ncbi:MAG: hypothetical protein HYX67_17060 [Candidatus Melainabacteria bacterium]|nr:hypothetical protein [Candidatus Melainabacteria bacterium]
MTHSSKRTRTRNAKGASIILVAFCAIGLIALVWGAFQLMIVMGGSREVRNAVDSAVLNVGKHAVDVEVMAPGGYTDVANSDGSISISNLSRVWGKAFIINANAKDMDSEGQAGPNSQANAQSAYSVAQGINNTLSSQLQDKNTFQNHFNSIARSSPAKLLGQNAVVQDTPTVSSWSTAMMDKGAESNLYFNPNQLPPGSGANVSDLQRGNKSFFRGYTELTVNGKDFVLPSFRVGEMPHLISADAFKKNLTNQIGSSSPIPNAYQESGIVTDGSTTLTANACAQSNPQRQWSLAIPHAYVSIIFQNLSKWYLDKDPKTGQWILRKIIPYGTTPGQTIWGLQQVRLRPPPPADPPNGIGGLMDGYATVGNEYKIGNAWDLYNTLPGDHTTPMMKLVQRVREIDPNFTIQRMQSLLQSSKIPGTDKPFIRFIIYPKYNGPNCTEPTMQIAALGYGETPPWMALPPTGDGIEKVILTEETMKDEPNTCWDNVVGGTSASCSHHTEYAGTVNWTPSTGVSQCLGELRVARVTNIYFTSDPG